MLEIMEDNRTRAQRYSDWVCEFCGSWGFVISFSVIIALWILLNVSELLFHPFDQYPFILLNLFLTIISTMQSPLIMMSQNRQTERDKEAFNKQAERDREAVKGLHEKLDRVLEEITKI